MGKLLYWRDRSDPPEEYKIVIAEYNEWNLPENPVKEQVVWYVSNEYRTYPSLENKAYCNRWRVIPR
jgi:hypothetical protein